MKRYAILAGSGAIAQFLLASPCYAAGGGSGEQSFHAFIAMIVTQALGFAILYLILKKFAFGPVLKVMDDRRDRVASDYRKIGEEREELQKSKEEYEKRLSEVEDEARVKIRDAIREGQELAEQVKTDAQAEAQELLQKARELLESEREKASVALRSQIVELTVATAEKLIRERLDGEMHRQLISDFIDSMPSAQR